MTRQGPFLDKNRISVKIKKKETISSNGWTTFMEMEKGACSMNNKNRKVRGEGD